MLSPALEDQERHVLVKVIDRVLFKLQDGVGAYVHKILHVIEPMLIDADYYVRVEGREVIANLSKAVGEWRGRACRRCEAGRGRGSCVLVFGIGVEVSLTASPFATTAGLAKMISTMRPDLDSPDEYVRNTTSKVSGLALAPLSFVCST